jgi:hypothetical protein
MNAETFVHRACEELTARHGAHTVFLYGSRADGSASEDSDYDLAAFAGGAAVVRDARLVEGSYLDAFIYPESVLVSPTEDHLKLRGSQVLVQRGSDGTGFLERLEQLYGRGPEPLSQDEAAARKAWAYKMVARARRSDAEGNFRRAWLLTALLEDYFSLRGKWYEGPKKALGWLEQFDKSTFGAFRQALEPEASLEVVARLVPVVVGAQDA